MRINRGFLAWGVFLVLVGAVPLAERAGYLTSDQIRNVGSLWPLVLIGIGIVLARTRLAFVGGVLIAATFGLIVGGLLSGGIEGFGVTACGPGSQTAAFATRDGALTGTSAAIDLQLNCGDATVSTTSGNGWRVEGSDRNGNGPNLNANNDSLSVRSHDSDGGPFGMVGERETWRIALPDAVRLDLAMELNAGSSMIDLGNASVHTLRLDVNAGSAVLDLGSVRELGDLHIQLDLGSLNLTLPNQSFSGSVEANAGSVNLCVPPGAGLKLRTNDSIVASYDVGDHGMVKTGSTWQTPGFDAAAVRIELDTQANAGSFSLNPEGGCDG